MRRLRRTSGIRRMLRETHLSPADLVQPLFVRHGGGALGRDRLAARPAPPRHRRPGRGGRGRAGGGGARGDPVRPPGAQGRGRERGVGPGGDRAARRAGDQGGAARSDRDHRRVPVPVHLARPLRRAARRRRRQRRHARAPGRHRGLACGSRCRHGGAVGHDGRPGRGDPHVARQRGPDRDGHPRLQRQVRLGVLRPVPRRRRTRPRPRATAGATRWIPANGNEAVREALLDIEEGADCRHGQAGAALPRRAAAPADGDARAARRLPGERRVRDARGGRGARSRSTGTTPRSRR